jgi:hypothetical protein
MYNDKDDCLYIFIPKHNIDYLIECRKNGVKIHELECIEAIEVFNENDEPIKVYP